MESQPNVGLSQQSPGCPKCGKQMVVRCAGRGANKGDAFWGCPSFPKCKGTIFNTVGTPADTHESRPASEASNQAREHEPSGQSNKIGAFFSKVAKGIEKVRRWDLESDEPDASGRWDPAHRRKVLNYVYSRDGERCGLCAGEMKAKGAHIEHIVPKIFAVFDVHKGGIAVQGTRYRSLLHKLDNLQAAHTYCNKRKGNTQEIRKWRHPSMPALCVATAGDGSQFSLPWHPSQHR